MRAPTTVYAKHISLPLEKCIAKTWKQNGKTLAGRTVEDHCRIAWFVAEELVARYNSQYTGLIPSYAPLGALLHDVGKVCPTFEAKIYDAIDPQSRKEMQELRKIDPTIEKNWGGHAAVSLAAVMEYGLPSFLARVTGAHHGKNPKYLPADREGYGDTSWHKRRNELLDRLLKGKSLPVDVPDENRERVLCGLTTVADWISSGPLFDDPSKDGLSIVRKAVDAAGFCPLELKKNLSFEDVFSFSPRHAQKLLYEAVQGPGVYVLEAPMGLGKTEAALYAAYRMLCKKCALGIYFALPTRLTSNRIHDRVNSFLKQILIPDQQTKSLLLHSTSWLERFSRQELGEEGAPNGSWFSQGKRGILAPFAVGTVDQALLSAMHVRYGQLRTFGLAGKVVILDEIHSYDVYTGTLLDALIQQLRSIGCTVILLSATLTTERRSSLLGGLSCQETAYPCVFSAPCDADIRSYSCKGPEPTTVTLAHPENDSLAVEEALLRAEEGQRVLWIENTVAEAQERYLYLAARAASIQGAKVGLLHSRFTPHDRDHNEAIWTSFFSPQAEGRGGQGGIVVGTQVVEQSLDIDADFLITRFCPTDMLLQRLGRLWRHTKTVRIPSASREAWLLHPLLSDAMAAPEQAFGQSGKVYAPYVLIRSLEVWHNLFEVVLPSDIRQMIEATYADREEKCEKIKVVLHKLLTKRKELRGKALIGIATALPPADDNTADDNIVPTRWETYQTYPVLLLRSWNSAKQKMILADGNECTLTLTTEADVSRARHSRTAALLARNVVTVPEYLTPESRPPDILKHWMYCGDLRVALVGEDQALSQLDGTYPVRPLRYTSRIGYAEGLPRSKQ
ncbi:MAG: CRISPR-associated helicase Cas3' [Desulfovibrio sp.]|nr:CRISPR-associated helicase Cas3' [Desulfovibrio sp.]